MIFTVRVRGQLRAYEFDLWSALSYRARWLTSDDDERGVWFEVVT